MNSLYQQLNSKSQAFPLNNNLQQLINIFKASSNPQQAINRIIQNNPQLQNLYSLIKNNNKNPKDLFYSLANQRGVDPNSILKLLQ